MNLKNDIKPISYIKTHAADIIKTINNTHRPIIITQSVNRNYHIQSEVSVIIWHLLISNLS